jgi:hypothetical protein
MSDYNGSLVNLSIPENVTKPIIAAKIQEAVTIAMGGADKIIAGVVHQICNTKVNPKDGKVDQYSSNNTMSWMDYHVTSLLQNSIQEELARQVKDVASPIREELVKQLQTKKGASAVAAVLLSSMEGTFGNNYTSKIEIKFESKKSGY